MLMIRAKLLFNLKPLNAIGKVVVSFALTSCAIKKSNGKYDNNILNIGKIVNCEGIEDNVKLHSPTISLTSDISSISATKPRSLLRRWFDMITNVLWSLFRACHVFYGFSHTIILYPLYYYKVWDDDKWWWNSLRDAICFCGPCYIKLAQWIGTRPDVFAKKLCDEMKLLQVHSNLHSWNSTCASMTKEFGENWSQDMIIYPSSILGCGCIAQVYKGNLFDNKTMSWIDVVVKVQHPNIRQSISDDIRLLTNFATMVEFIVGLWDKQASKCLSFVESADEFSMFMSSQLNFDLEHDALNLFRNNFNTSYWRDKVTFPAPLDLIDGNILIGNSNNNTYNEHTELYSSKSKEILLETRAEGVLMTEVLDDFDNMPASTRREIAMLGIDAMLKMIFEDNFIHADLHPGNILLCSAHKKAKDSQEIVYSHPVKLTFIDAGLCTKMHEEDFTRFLNLFQAIISNDGKRAAKMLIDDYRGGVTEYSHTVINREQFENSVAELVDEVVKDGLIASKHSISTILLSIFELCHKHHVKLEPRYVSVVLALGVVDGLGTRLDPTIDILSRSAPYIARATAKQVMKKFS